MKDSGRTTYTMDEENFIMLVVIFMKENLLMTWLKVLASTNMQMVPSMLVTGIKTNNMALVRKNGMMEVSIKVSIRMHPKKAKENTVGLMETGMLVSGKTTCLTGEVYLSGMMIDFSSVNGKTI